jgi:DNA-binding MarR family transcriptional regulator
VVADVHKIGGAVKKLNSRPETATKKKKNVDVPGDRAAVHKSAGKTPATEPEEHFPPLSTSLPAFLVNGSDSAFRHLIYNVLSVSALMLQARERFAIYIGVTAAQYTMMVAIGEAKATTVGQLATELSVSSPFVTAEINKLIKLGLVEKLPNEADRRSMLLALTPQSKDLIREVAPMRRLANDTIFGSLTKAQAKELVELNAILLADAKHALHELDSPKWSAHRKRAASAAPASSARSSAVPALKKARKKQ